MADITTIKFLSLTGLTAYDAKIKAFVESKVAEGDAKSLKYVDLVDGVLKFYTVNPIDENSVPAFEIELPEQDLSHLMELVDGAVAGDVAVFGENGQVVDGNVKLADLVTKAEVQAVQTDVDELADLVGVIPEGYEATTIAQYAKELADNVAANGYDDTELAGRVTAIEEDYLTSEDKTELEGKIGAAQAKGEEALTHSEGVAEDLATETTERKAADEAQVGRIAALEEQIVGLSGAMHFKGVVEGDALPETTEGYEDGDVVIFGNKEYVVNNGAFVEFGDVNAQAEAITELVGRMDTAEGEIDQLQTDLDAAEEALAKKAEQSALDQEIADREALAERVVELEKVDHEHANKELLDTYTQTEEDLADAVAKKHEHANAEELAKVADGDVAKWNAMEGNASAYTDAEIDKVEAVIGTVAENKTVVDMIADAQVAATYNDEEVRDLISGNATDIENLEKLHADDKQALEAKDAAIEGNVTQLQEDVAALKAVEHQEISLEEINAMFEQA